MEWGFLSVPRRAARVKGYVQDEDPRAAEAEVEVELSSCRR
jgi:hypothetical protein